MKPSDIQALIRHVGCGSVDEAGCCVFCDQIRARLRAALAHADERDDLRAALEVPAIYWREYFAAAEAGGQCWTIRDEFWRQWLDAYGHLVPESPQSAAAVDPADGIVTLADHARKGFLF